MKRERPIRQIRILYLYSFLLFLQPLRHFVPPPLYFCPIFSTPLSFGHSPYILRCKNTPPCCGTRQGRGLCYKGLSFPAKESPCYTNSLYLFILLNSEKNEPRSAAAVIGLLGSSPQSPSGSAELASLGQSSPFFLRLPCDFTAR